MLNRRTILVLSGGVAGATITALGFVAYDARSSDPYAEVTVVNFSGDELPFLSIEYGDAIVRLRKTPDGAERCLRLYLYGAHGSTKTPVVSVDVQGDYHSYELKRMLSGKARLKLYVYKDRAETDLLGTLVPSGATLH